MAGFADGTDFFMIVLRAMLPGSGRFTRGYRTEASMKVKDVLWILVLGGAAAFGYRAYDSSKAEATPLQAPLPWNLAPVPEVEDRSWIKRSDARPAFAGTPASKCDGRTSCPQMTSCAEATYFIQRCPDTAMDGDRDGIPCEDQWCRQRTKYRTPRSSRT